MIVLNLLFLIDIHLLICLPIPSIHASIDVQHLSESFPEIIHIMPFVDVSIGPSEDSIPLLFIIQPLSLVLIASSRAFLPHALAASQSIFEISFEKTARGPVILSIA